MLLKTIICKNIKLKEQQKKNMALAKNGAEIPLLPQTEQTLFTRENQQLILRAVFNVSTSIIGAGIMSVPATLKVLGVIPAFVLIILVALLVDISVDFMLRFTYRGESKTYAALMNESFGKIGSVAVQICVMITNLGCLIMYLIIIGKCTVIVSYELYG